MTSMKPITHLLLALVLVTVSLSILIITHTNDSVKALDFARLYTMRWMKGDGDSALLWLRDDSWLSDQCQASMNLSSDPTCLARRTDIRDGILRNMKCDTYGSQTCSYLKLVLRALVRTSTTERVGNATSAFKVFGSNLKGKAPNGESYQQILQNIIRDAPRIFHGAYKAEQSDKTLVLRSALYNLILMAILGNIVMHICDSYENLRPARPWVRVITFVMVFITAFIMFCVNPGNALVLWLILAPAMVSLLYFELFLDETIVRPWIHPFVFSIIYTCTTLLALVENGILDYNVIVIHLLFSMCAAQMFMSSVWFFVGLREKENLTGAQRILHVVYQGKEVQLALLGSFLLQLWIPLHQGLSPYNYTYNSLFLLFAPSIFAVLALLSTVFVQDMTLDDNYDQTPAKDKAVDPTAITAGKMFVSLLLLVYGTVILLVYFTEHMATYRAYLDTMPEASIQYDPLTASRKFLIGPGLSAL